MKPNIGILNALCRFIIGYTLMAIATQCSIRRPFSYWAIVFAMLGGMKIGEGTLRFCPLTALFRNGKGRR
ncbi:YgaP family membrane protein [Salsuginibacillus kocurii]|uniref:YgaP family membrane protein n=1 Tax=Salsuginibacillus kocurii TaxID=427078 RepID=UPI000369F678|nr:DUF2892 domain-containing protein [Salsuginibacillus kocurii]